MSNQPPPYNRQYNFEDYQAINPTTPLPGEKVEAELNAARSSINQTISRLNELQNADGSLKVPGALVAETNATATSVATSVATSTAQAYLAANYDPTVAVQAAASASDAASWATDAANSKQLAEANMVNAEAAASVAQNAAIDSAIARSESRGHAIDANESRNEAHASAQAAAASYADVGQVYGSALSLKNWIDSQSYQFVHKREETSHIAANMLFNDGEADNTLIGKIFQGAEMDANSNVTYPGPINNFGYNGIKGPWWVVGNPEPENPEKIVMRDMMNCLVHTWLAFGPSVASGEMKPMEPGVNGAPNDNCKDYGFVGKLIEPVIYTRSDFNTKINSPTTRTSALTPKGYVDQRDAQVMSAAQQASSTADTARAEVQQFRTSEYDNGRVYGPHEIVKFGSKLYWFNDFIGAAGYAPDTHPNAWTELSPQVDVSGFATESFVTSQGYLTSIPSFYATESWVNAKGGISNLEYSLNYSDPSVSSYTDTPVGVFDGQIGFTTYNLTITSPQDSSVSSYAGYTVNFILASGTSNVSYDHQLRTVTFEVNTMSGSNMQDAFSAINSNGSGWTFGGNLTTAYYVNLTELSGKSFLMYAQSFQIGTTDKFVNARNLWNDFTKALTDVNVNSKIIGTDAVGKTKFYDYSELSNLEFARRDGVTFTGKANFTPVSGNAGLNVGIGGTSTASTTNGDLWIASGGVSLNYRDGNGAWRIVAITNSLNTFSSPQIINTTSTTTALRVTQAGTGNSFLVEDSTTPDTSAFVVDASGNVGVGVASGYTSTSKVEVVGNVKATTLSTGSGPTFSLNSTAEHTGGSSTLDAIVTINGVNYRISLRPA
jgi:hypothetical protein